MDEDEYVDAKLLEKKETRFTAIKKQATDLQRAITADRRATATTARCWWCPESRERKAHLVVAEGEHGAAGGGRRARARTAPAGAHCYLSLTRERRLDPLHCVIVPKEVGARARAAPAATPRGGRAHPPRARST